MRALVLAIALAVGLCGIAGAEDRAVEDAKRFFYSGQTRYKLGELDAVMSDARYWGCLSSAAQ